MGAPLPARSGRGIVVYEAFDAIMAHVVEVAVDGNKAVRVNRIVTVADPGVVYDPGSRPRTSRAAPCGD